MIFKESNLKMTLDKKTKDKESNFQIPYPEEHHSKTPTNRPTKNPMHKKFKASTSHTPSIRLGVIKNSDDSTPPEGNISKLSKKVNLGNLFRFKPSKSALKENPDSFKKKNEEELVKCKNSNSQENESNIDSNLEGDQDDAQYDQFEEEESVSDSLSCVSDPSILEQSQPGGNDSQVHCPSITSIEMENFEGEITLIKEKLKKKVEKFDIDNLEFYLDLDYIIGKILSRNGKICLGEVELMFYSDRSKACEVQISFFDALKEMLYEL